MTADCLPPSDEVRTLKLSGHVGFDSLPNQLVNKAVSQGFEFNILCVGETGIGKSTLLETLFYHKFDHTVSNHDLLEPKLLETTCELKEANVQLRLTMVETCGYADQLNKEDNVKPIIDYVNGQFEKYLQEELKIKRSIHNFRDTRIHACLYFISPTGHGLKSLDVAAMKELQDKVSIIPIIAKSDTVTRAELHAFKARILADIESNNIEIYKFPTDDEAVSELNAKMNKLVPFAVVGSSEEVKINGKSVRVRQYPWGSIQVENESHCDFLPLRDMLLHTNMEDLRERAHMVHYETYRRQRLVEMGFRDDDKMSLQETYEKRREMQRKELQQKEEEMRQLFVQRVKDKEQLLKETERELQAKFESLKASQAVEKRRLEEKKRILEDEMASFERRKQAAEQAKLGHLKKKK